jgi:hypothetical protein
MKRLELLLEEESSERAMRNLVPKIVKPGTRYDIRFFQGKSELLKNLPNRLNAYTQQSNLSDLRIVVLVDRDNDDCQKLKADLERIARKSGFISRTAAGKGNLYQIVNRIAIEELEAWFLGDIEALLVAYPRLNQAFKHIRNKKEFNYPDIVSGGTWETLQKILQRAGYYPQGLLKLEAARKISQHMEPSRNKSRSFQLFCQALLEITA